MKFPSHEIHTLLCRELDHKPQDRLTQQQQVTISVNKNNGLSIILQPSSSTLQNLTSMEHDII